MLLKIDGYKDGSVPEENIWITIKKEEEVEEKQPYFLVGKLSTDKEYILNKHVQITVDENIEDFIIVEEDEENDEQYINKLKIKSVLLDSGILIVNNGKISLLKAEEKSVLSYQNGQFKWISYTDCENACE